MAGSVHPADQVTTVGRLADTALDRWACVTSGAPEP